MNPLVKSFPSMQMRQHSVFAVMGHNMAWMNVKTTHTLHREHLRVCCQLAHPRASCNGVLILGF